MGRLLYKLTGERRFTIAEEDCAKLLSLIGKKKLWVYGDKRDSGNYSFYAGAKDAKAIIYMCRNNCIPVEASPLLGIPGFILKYKKRYGIFIGAVVFVLAVFFSKYFIWDFEVRGNESISDDAILAGLEELGCTYGSFIPGIDFEMLANEFLLESDDISWISVNMRSSLAVVEVLERKKGEPAVQNNENKYANITATEDAEIFLPEISAGKSVVAPGDVVKKGELLATGVINVGEDGVRYEYANGSVLGKVYREINIDVPLSGEKKVYTGRKCENKFVKIFGKTKNLFGNGGIDYIKYDKIEERKQLSFFDTVTVPVWLGVTSYAEYEYQPCEFTEDEAAAMAKTELSECINGLLSEGEIVSMETAEETDENGCRINCRLYLIKDIAGLSEFTVSDNSVKGVTE